MKCILPAWLALFSIFIACPVCSQTPAPNPHAAQSCLAPAAWYSLNSDAPRLDKPAELLGAMAKRDVVLLGEHHDDQAHHEWQLQTLAMLHLLRPQLIIGFESFPRRVQPALDKWVAGELTVKQFLEQSDWKNVWNMPAELYLPLFQFARINRIPMIALNVDRRLTQAVRERGWEAVAVSEKEGVSRPAPASPAYVDMLFEVYRQHPESKGSESTGKNDPAFRRFVESQVTWDRAMAQALAQRSKAANLAERPLLVGIMGAAHVRSFAVPNQLRELGIDKVGALLPVESTEDCKGLKSSEADAIFALPPALDEAAPPPRLGVQVNQTEQGVFVNEVVPGSLAEKTGIQRGDRIVSLAGTPVSKTSSVIATVRAQPAGTWLPVQLRRGEQTLDLVIKFPPQK
jgi:uncharacterized iron-regulated protein